MAKDVFISHSSHDKVLAQSICAHLEQNGLSCWIAPRDIEHGQSWGGSIMHALTECPVLLLVLTAHANASGHVIKEVTGADGKSAHILTFRVESVSLNPTLEYFLSADQWLDAVGRPLHDSLPDLVDAVGALCQLKRGTPRAASLAGAAVPQPVLMSDSELVDAFNESAPDDWDRLPRSGLGRYLQRLFADH